MENTNTGETKSPVKKTVSFDPKATDRSSQFVTKRNGQMQLIDKSKIKARLEHLARDLDKVYINLDVIVEKVYQGIYAGVTTKTLDNLAAETCAYMSLVHPDINILAARIAVSNLHKQTKESFSEVIANLRNYKDKLGNLAPLIAEDVYHIVMANKAKLDAAVDYKRDLNYDFFGFKTLERSYLLKIDGEIAERPQHMLMRVSVGIHGNDIDAAIETYNYMSEKWFTHATPTLFNAGTPKPQMSSCFLLWMQDDSIDGIYDTLKQCALISKSAGGIGVAIHNIRATGSYIRGTNGVSNGIVPMLRVYNETARYVDQGGGKRKGSFAIYLEPWHADVYDFLNLRKNHGKEEQRARDLFFALWVSDLFMKRVEANADWTLMCPNECPGLFDVWGQEFEDLYTRYEAEGRGRRVVKAQHLWTAIIDSQIETGVPYMLFKDSVNGKSNQKNLGTIKSSNLCTEICEYTSKDEVAVCNLASISLSRFVENGVFDYKELHKITQVITRNLNKVIDRNYYPLQECKNSNLRHRPIGIGVQGLADAFMKMKISFESEEAAKINEWIFETIYHASMTASLELAMKDGPYDSFKGSPTSFGVFQFDMWKKVPSSGRYDWDTLKEEVQKYGIRNSLLVAPMPTASTSQVLGNNESFEPYTNNLYTRRVLAGEFVCVNPHLVKDLIALDLWNIDVKNQLIAFNGSIQGIKGIPAELKKLYRTVWEIPQKTMVELAIGRAPYICQSQSLNIYMAEPSYAKMSSLHFYTWKSGLKTGQYYLRSKPAADAIKFTLNMEALLKAIDTKDNEGILKYLNKEADPSKVVKRSVTKRVSKSAPKRTINELEGVEDKATTKRAKMVDTGEEDLEEETKKKEADNSGQEQEPEGQTPEGQEPEEQEPEGQEPEGQEPEGQEFTCPLNPEGAEGCEMCSG